MYDTAFDMLMSEHIGLYTLSALRCMPLNGLIVQRPAAFSLPLIADLQCSLQYFGGKHRSDVLCDILKDLLQVSYQNVDCDLYASLYA